MSDSIQPTRETFEIDAREHAGVDTIDGVISPEIRALMAAFRQAQFLHPEFTRVRDMILPLAGAFNQQFETIAAAAKSMAATTAALLPPEWDGFSEDEFQLGIDLATGQGIATVRAPRQKIIRALFDAPEDEALGVLMENRTDVLDDIEQAIEQIPAGVLADWPVLARKSLEAYRAGHEEASQALSAALLTTMIHEMEGRYLAKARRTFEELEPDQVAMRKFRLAVILRAVATTISETEGEEPQFHRHASIHHASLDQYSSANALSALLLISNLVRELVNFAAAREDETD